MSSSAKDDTGGAESAEDSNSVVEDSNSVSSKPEEDAKQPRVAKKKGSDTSSSGGTTTNEPSSTSAAATVVAGQPASQSEQPTIAAAAAAAAASPVPRNDQPRRPEFREQFQNTSATATEETVVERHSTSQSSGLPTFADAAAAAAPPVPLREKKPRRAGFREQFLQKLRVMLDRESQNDNSIVKWSTDGKSFIITDQTRFEADIIPTYFDNPIIFASFLNKLYRWGFNRLSSRQTGRHEFSSPTFRRLGADSAPAAAAADLSKNAGGGASSQDPQQQTRASSLLQVMAQISQQPAPNLLPSHADAIADLISNIQRISQQPVMPSQQSALNRLQPFQQWQHPNPTMNLLSTALGILVGSQPPSAQPIGYSPVSPQGDAIQALMNLYGMSLRAGTFPNTSTTPAMSQTNNMAIQSLLMLMNRVGEDERQRRVHVDATQSAIIATIGQILGLGGSGGTANLNVPSRNPTGMTVSVPYNTAVQAQHGMPPPSASSLNFQADSIAAILHAARSTAGGQLEEVVAPQPQMGLDDVKGGKDEGKEDHERRPLSRRKRKCPDDSDDDINNNPRKK